MTLGFKTGPRTWEETKPIVAEDGGKFCEIWFNVGKVNEYEDMFTWLEKHSVRMGLHYWGLIDGRIKPNLCTKITNIREETINQIKQTIDIAKKINAIYVNVHPGARALEEMNFDTRTQKLVPGQETSEVEAWEALSASAKLLQDYAESLDILLTIETLPGREAEFYEIRENLYNPNNASLAWLEKLGQQGNWLANDITHTASMMALAEQDPDRIWQQLFDYSQKIAPATRLVHLNTMVPPFNGADTHNGLTREDWAAGAWPNADQIVEFLKIFKNRDDVFIVPEPRQNIRENYKQLTALHARAIH